MVKYVSLVDGNEYEMPDNIQVTGMLGVTSPTIRRDEEIIGPEDTYLLFAWDDYSALGGNRDFQKTFNTIGAAIEWFSKNRFGNADLVVFKRKRFKVVATYSEEWDDNLGKWVYGWRRPR
jgi:hypothetical protein